MKPRPATLATLLLVLLGAGALAWWSIDRAPRLVRADGPSSNDAEIAALVAPKTQSLAPKTNDLDFGAKGKSYGLEVTGVQARRNRSPLESSPGYYPPDDPESLSVIRGRREAPEIHVELEGGCASLDAFARAVLSGIERKDERALHAMRVTRSEFETILWPEFPQSRPITHIPVSEAWGFTTAKSLAGVSRVVGAYGGRHLTLLRADYARSETFRNFNLLRDVRILIRDPRDGRMVTLAVAPSVVERHGRYKALIFKD